MQKDEQARLTVDIPLSVHTKLKAIAALSNKSMRDVLVDLINKHLSMKTMQALLKK